MRQKLDARLKADLRHASERQITVIWEYRHLSGINAHPLQMGIYAGDDMVV